MFHNKFNEYKTWRFGWTPTLDLGGWFYAAAQRLCKKQYVYMKLELVWLIFILKDSTSQNGGVTIKSPWLKIISGVPDHIGLVWIYDICGLED